MAIEVQICCSECGAVSDKLLDVNDGEIVCPECRRNMPNLSKEEFKEVKSTLGMQRLMGILAILLLIGAAALFVFYANYPATWVSTDSKDYWAGLAKTGITKQDTSPFLYGAGACILLAAVFGALSARKRYVVEF